MQTAVFYGSSDDLIEVEGVKGADEFGAWNGGEAGVRGAFNVGGKLIVRALYDGCWSFAVGQADESIPLPDWPIRITQGHEYSVRLEIDVPDDVKVFRVLAGDEDV